MAAVIRHLVAFLRARDLSAPTWGLKKVNRLTVAFCLVTAALQAQVASGATGSQVVGPTIQSMPSREVRARCYGSNSFDADLTMVVILNAQGRPTRINFPPGIGQDLKQAAECIVMNMTFTPGMINGHPVVSQARLPLNFRRTSSRKKATAFTRPELKTSPDDFEAISGHCYPADYAQGGHVVLRIKVSEWGDVKEQEIAESSGNPKVDDIALCIAPRLKFTPGRRGRVRIDLTITWPLDVRPPGSKSRHGPDRLPALG